MVTPVLNHHGELCVQVLINGSAAALMVASTDMKLMEELYEAEDRKEVGPKQMDLTSLYGTPVCGTQDHCFGSLIVYYSLLCYM